MSSVRPDPQSVAEQAVSVIGFGYDLTLDIRLAGCKPGPSGSRLIKLDETVTRDLVFPGGVVVSGVSAAIKCDKGERTRFCSDVLPFNQMSEQFNKEMSLSGKVPSGPLNAMFDFKQGWQKDAAEVKSLAFDGWFITLYNIELARSQITLSEDIKKQVPSSWDPASLAEFIENYGTHVIVGVKMGGKDVTHVKQLQNSNLQPSQVQIFLKQLADENFSEDVNGNSTLNRDELAGTPKGRCSVAWDVDLPATLLNTSRPPVTRTFKNEKIVSIRIRRGGFDNGQSHKEWLSTVSKTPGVISMSLVPITSLLSSVRGCGFVSHAVNLYLRYKPQIEDLHQFLEFQLPREWAPTYGDLPLGIWRKKHVAPSLQFTFMGPKLYVNTVKVDSKNRPVTGIRLFLEGKKGDHLAIHLQHLSDFPNSFQLSGDHSYEVIDEQVDRAYFEPVKWTIFSHVCTAPVEYKGAHINDPASIATKARFEVKMVGLKKVLFLRLGFSMVASAKIRRSEWEGPTSFSRKSGSLSMLISTRFSTGLTPPENKQPMKVDLNSAVYPGGPPSPMKAPKMSNFVDTKEKVRGPEDAPGYWVITGAKLSMEGGKIGIKAKYSLLSIIYDDSMLM